MYLNFTTNESNSLLKRSNGAPIHDGKMPIRYKDVAGVKIDGEEVNFKDESIVDSLQKTLLKRKSFVRQHEFDCLSFAGLMIDYPNINTSVVPFLLIASGINIDPEDIANESVANIFKKTNTGGDTWVHVAVPAHTLEQPMYIHKLGNTGPLCLSGLSQVIEMYHADNAQVAELFVPPVIR